MLLQTLFGEVRARPVFPKLAQAARADRDQNERHRSGDDYDRNQHDSPEFRPLLEAGAQTFAIDKVTANKAYNSREDVELVSPIGADPYIPFRSTAKENSRWHEATPTWSKLFHLYNYRREEFLSHYHARSNAESTFSAMKRGLWGYLAE